MGRLSQSVVVGTSAQASVRTKQGLAPSVIQGLEVLSLPLSQLTHYVYDAAEQNPLLDIDFEKCSINSQTIPNEADDPSQSETAFEETGFSEKFSDYQLLSHTTVFRTACDLARIPSDSPEVETLQTYLSIGLSKLALSSNQKRCCEIIIASIDDQGYFLGNLLVAGSSCGLSLEQAQVCLSYVQSLGPAGVGARDLKECLLLQLQNIENVDPLLKTIIESDLEVLAFNKATQLFQEFGVSHEQKQDMRQILRRLNPHPGYEFDHKESTTYIIPDLIIRQSKNDWDIQVTGEIAETLTLHGQYIKILNEGLADKQALEWMQAKRSDAELILRNIDQRKQTLHKLGRLLLEEQYCFFLLGPNKLRPLTMQECADILDLHVSTISRAVKDKYVETPWGIFSLKYFFSPRVGCIQAERQTGISATVIKNRINEIIGQENCKKPLSDQSIMIQLNEEGIDIKRRTVAKYRDSLGIGIQSQRRW